MVNMKAIHNQIPWIPNKRNKHKHCIQRKHPFTFLLKQNRPDNDVP